MKTAIKVQYSGVIRLLTGKKEDEFIFPGNITLGELFEHIGDLYGEEVYRECMIQVILLYDPGCDTLKRVKLTDDAEEELTKGCQIKVISPITGG